jgi:hypothetical protein
LFIKEEIGHTYETNTDITRTGRIATHRKTDDDLRDGYGARHLTLDFYGFYDVPAPGMKS